MTNLRTAGYEINYIEHYQEKYIIKYIQMSDIILLRQKLLGHNRRRKNKKRGYNKDTLSLQIL